MRRAMCVLGEGTRPTVSGRRRGCLVTAMFFGRVLAGVGVGFGSAGGEGRGEERGGEKERAVLSNYLRYSVGKLGRKAGS
ncbi:hypothetical protein IF1G_07908 [Cordyceps javanica]|uniref:Uncharacterized protein n=1 Tax=Cordyceps javanica TaxID=43265 RepID=A0A545UV49_9HYPO|nr:hypothetical protein IF1G_07908 [Cordyceps javanica]